MKSQKEHIMPVQDFRQNTRFGAATAAFDQANSKDPNRETHEGREVPKEVLYAQRMTTWLDRFEPDAAEVVHLAARSQHIRRWEIPRDEYPMDRAGYKRWRVACARMHAELAGKILTEAGYDDETIQRVQDLLQKKKLKLDPDVQLLEDVICLVFLEHYFADFALKHDEEKLIGIIQKTWKKMSERGREFTLQHVNLAPEHQALVEKALAEKA